MSVTSGFFANIGEEMKRAFRAYDEEVKAKTFPAAEHNFAIDPEIIQAVKEKLS